MAVKTLTINGQMVSGREGETILEAAQDANIWIPTLCHFHGLTDIGACRLCLVEIKGSAKLQPACVTKVEEGMEVYTDTPQLQAYRRDIIALLLAERNHVCSVCVANNHCELQSLAMALGVDHVQYEYLSPACEVDISHPRYGLDHNRCVMCQRCVRVCDAIEGAHVWDVAGRGVKARIISGLHQPWGNVKTCTQCGKCVLVCPTGALFYQGSSVAEMDRDRARLDYVITAREKKQWVE